MYVNARYPMDGETQDRLVEQAVRGDPDAFARIFDEYAAPIHRFIASRVNNPSDAEDLTQLVFVKALEALPRYEVRGIPFGGWLFRLAKNAIIDQIRTSLPRDGDDSGDRGRRARGGGGAPGRPPAGRPSDVGPDR